MIPWSEESFEGIPLQSKTVNETRLRANLVECPKCKGRGKCWRHSVGGSLLQCGQCDGWGYVYRDSKDATCVHEWRFTRNLGICYNEYTCANGCGSKINVDSSG